MRAVFLPKLGKWSGIFLRSGKSSGKRIINHNKNKGLIFGTLYAFIVVALAAIIG